HEGTNRHVPGNIGEISNLYARRSASATKTAAEDLAEFAFKGSQAGVEQVPFRNDDDVDAGHGLVATKNLSYQSFSSVPLDGAAEFPRGGDAEPAVQPPGRQRKQREEPAVDLDAA